MKRITTLILSLVAIALFTFSFAPKNIDEAEAVEEVKELVYNAYINGAFNELSAEAMCKGFHEDFAIYSPKGEAISKYPIANWADGVAKKKSNNYDPKDPKNKWDHKFANVDVTGHAAQVKVELFNQGKHVYTDYLSLLKFESGWRIVAKVYMQH
ncbi:MAG: nuclear transport factor 2 family protein [Cytophagia bacterium]|nr:nuclear transport factor 2 family protein [Cytophagia bacterium]